MPRLIVLRLHPDKPVTGNRFTDYLSNLTIQAFDASFASPTGEGTPLPGASQIVQHEKVQIPQNLLLAVATAVIVLPAPPPAEYAEPDLILHIKRNGNLIRKIPVNYNVAITDNLPSIPNNVTTLEPVAGYVALPDPSLAPKPTDAVVELPQDGTPPNFTALLDAVTKVLQADPTTPVDLAALTPAKCRHIAHEIAWNRHVYPLASVSNDTLGLMYTAPVTDENSNARVKFEGELAQYRAVHDAEAEVLAKYIFALSAAIACQNKSNAAVSAGLRFPIQPNASQSGKVHEAEVVLAN